MTNPFKRGDVVECIDDNASPLTRGEKYVVQDDDLEWVRIMHSGRVRAEGFYPKRFRLAGHSGESGFTQHIMGVADPITGQLTFYGPFPLPEEAISWANADGIPDRNQNVFELREPRKT